MLSHAGMLESRDASYQLQECRQEPERAWEQWKEFEGKNR